MTADLILAAIFCGATGAAMIATLAACETVAVWLEGHRSIRPKSPYAPGYVADDGDYAPDDVDGGE
jgi:hypothetical protein